ncbi:hypothetical protein EAG_00770, partial [Camponotus floridanus]
YWIPIFTGRFLLFFSHYSLTHKKVVIVGLTDRAFKLLHPHTENFSFIINTLLNNGYPIHFIYHTIFHRLKYLISNVNVNTSSLIQPLPFSIPYFTIPF